LKATLITIDENVHPSCPKVNK